MQLDISKALRQPGEVFPFQVEVSIPPQDIFGEEIRFDDPAVLEGKMSLTEGRLRLWGHLSASAHGPCAKCLAPAQHQVKVHFDELVSRKGEEPVEEDVLEENDRLAYDGPQLNVDQLALTLAVLDLPIRFLCSEDCPGLDQTLPEDQTHAGQKVLPDEHPFSALQQLLNKDQEV